MADLRGIDKLGELKFKNLWVLSIQFGSEEGEAIDAYLVKTAGRPHMRNDETIVQHLNVERIYKTRSHWDPLTVELIDPIVNSAANKVWKWILKHHDPVTGMSGYKETYAVPLVSLRLISPVGTTIEEWELHNVWIQDADFQNLSYMESEPVNITMTLRYDWAELVKTTE